MRALRGSCLHVGGGLGDGALQRGRVRAADRVLDGAVAEDQEGRHGADAVLLRDLGLGVDVDFDEGELARDAVLAGERGEGGRDGFAGPAPVGVEIGDDVDVRGELRGEVVGGGDVGDAAAGHDGCVLITGRGG